MRSIAVVWKGGKPRGSVEVTQGRCVGLAIAGGEGEVGSGRFAFWTDGPCRLELSLEDVRLGHGADPTLVTVRTDRDPFTVLLRDVNGDCPILIPEYGAAVLPAEDPRSYEEAAESVRARGLVSILQRIESEPEESFEEAAAHTRSLRCPTWLGLSRDMRLFEVNYARESPAHTVRPRFHGYPVTRKETGDQPVVYSFFFSRAVACVEGLTRRLEEGALPILRGTLADDDVVYDFTAFVSTEASPLTPGTLRGTHYLVADGHGHGHMMTPEQRARYEALLPGEMARGEETVLYHRVVATNTSRVPRYAWFRCPTPNGAYRFDGDRGFGLFVGGGVFVAARLNAEPLPKEEVAVLLGPGEAAVFDFRLPHRPIPPERADALALQDFDARHAECRELWRGKLASGARVELPEKRVEQMLRAGLLHLDLVAYGLEPDQPVAPTIGVYCPIGSESSPILQALDSFGWHGLAERGLAYFLEKQHKDGFIQNFGGYMLETGAALWSMGEHYRYTRDEGWVRAVAPKLLKSCEYLLEWRRRNQREELRGRGYGLIDGKVADPEDPFHAFMLNGYAYLGLSRAAEMLSGVMPEEGARLASEAAAYRTDIRAAVMESLARSPVVPLRDGTWCPSLPPWAEGRGPVSLLTDGGRWFTHGGFTVRDSLLGPLYLILQEVLEPSEPVADWLLRYHADLFHTRNVAPSQPYYSPHALAHLRRGEVKAFLKAYYNAFAGLADRETYTFWEHFFHASPHKTHEEGWFLMQTRWMLWREEGDTLSLLPGVPRAWLESGKRLALRDVATYFGRVSLEVESRLDEGRILAEVECGSSRGPERVRLRLPHPLGRRAAGVTGGTYDPAAESVLLEPFEGRARVAVTY